MDGKRKGFLVALVIGLVAAPALALTASGLLGGEAEADESPTTTAAAGALVTTAPAAATTTTPAADLETACTTEGASLVAREAAGMLSDLQQAALDALRPICEAEGFAMEAAPGAEIAPPVTSAASPTAGAAEFDDDGDEGENEDEGEYEGESHEYEDENEGHEDESDEYEDEG